MNELNAKDVLLTEEEKNKLKEKSPMQMPLNPTAQGWSGQNVRSFIAKAIFDLDGGILALLEQKFEKTSDLFSYLFEFGTAGVEISSGDYPINENVKLWIKVLEDETTIYIILSGGVFGEVYSDILYGGTFDSIPQEITIGGTY